MQQLAGNDSGSPPDQFHLKGSTGICRLRFKAAWWHEADEEHFKQRGDASRAGPWQGKAFILNLCESRTVVVYSHPTPPVFICGIAGKNPNPIWKSDDRRQLQRQMRWTDSKIQSPIHLHVLLNASRTLSAKIKHHHDDKVCLFPAASGNVHPSTFRDKAMKKEPGF